jgi:hypothetical protein
MLAVITLETYIRGEGGEILVGISAGTPPSPTRFFMVFISPSTDVPELIRLGYDQFLPNPFQFTIIHHCLVLDADSALYLLPE